MTLFRVLKQPFLGQKIVVFKAKIAKFTSKTAIFRLKIEFFLSHFLLNPMFLAPI